MTLCKARLACGGESCSKDKSLQWEGFLQMIVSFAFDSESWQKQIPMEGCIKQVAKLVKNLEWP